MESGFVACTALQAAGGVLRWTHLPQPEKMHTPGSGGVPEKRPVPGREKRMTKLLHGNEKSSLTGGREPLFSQKELLVLAVPLLVEQLLEVTVGMADTMMVSRCGEAAISGVSLVDMINNLIIVLFAALATGGAVVVSQYLGAKERRNADKSAGRCCCSADCPAW